MERYASDKTIFQQVSKLQTTTVVGNYIKLLR